MARETVAAPGPRPADKVRNVALVGHAAAGKTTLAEALLVATGALTRAGRVEDGTTCLDSEEVEVRQQRSVSLGVATVEHDGHRITLLDTPGSPDFVGELRAGLRAMGLPDEPIPSGAGHDAAIFAQAGIPSAMIFIRNQHGSHNPAEAMEMDDFMLGAELLERSLREAAA